MEAFRHVPRQNLLRRPDSGELVAFGSGVHLEPGNDQEPEHLASFQDGAVQEVSGIVDPGAQICHDFRSGCNRAFRGLAQCATEGRSLLLSFLNLLQQNREIVPWAKASPRRAS